MKKKKRKNKYAPETAGAKMIKSVPVIRQDKKIKDARELLAKKEIETINYFYVIDKKGKLSGVFSIKEIFRRPEDALVKDIMTKKVVKAKAKTDQEKVARLALEHNHKSIPVVNRNEKLLGVVPSDVILDILHSEMSEDILKFAGISKDPQEQIEEINKAGTFKLVKLRIPWLIVGLLGGTLGARLVGIFKHVLDSYLILALFIPVMLYMAAAVGMQSQTLFIRRLVFERGLSFLKYLTRELKVGLLLALISGIIIFAVIYLGWQNPLFGFIIGLAMFTAMFIAIFVAVLIPWILYKFKKDPALGSGPFATAVQDILSLIIYFVISSSLVRIFF